MTDQAANPLSDRAGTNWSNSALVALWLGSIVVSWYCLETYAYSVDQSRGRHTIEQWPATTGIERQHDQYTLLLFLHPKCPCSQATLTELDRWLAAQKKSTIPALQLVVIASVPESADESWRNTATIERAKRIPNSRLVIDPGGREAARFGATTSGLVMLFDQFGNRKFAGGVTASRGHEGPNLGCDLLSSVFRGESSEIRELPVFGCRLCLPQIAPRTQQVNQAQPDGAKTRS